MLTEKLELEYLALVYVYLENIKLLDDLFEKQL